MAKPKPVLGICAECGEHFTNMAAMDRHSHPRIATTLEDHMDRTEAVEKAETCLERAHELLAPPAVESMALTAAARWTALGVSYIELAKLAG